MQYSFIIPAYNCEKTIADTIQSIECCKRFDYEIVIIDDGSTDHTSDVCNRMMESYNNIRYFYQKNMGVSYSRNQGIKKALGDYVIFVDSDDTIDSICLDQLILDTKSMQEVDLIVFGISFDYYYKGKNYRSDEMRPPFSGICKRDDWIIKLEELYNTNSLNSLCNKIFRKNILYENGIELNQNLFLYEDFDFFIRCLTYTDNIFFSDQCIYHYRQTEDQGNAGRRLKRIEHIDTLITELENSWNLFERNSESNFAKIINDSKKRILMSLYITLAKEKSEVSKMTEIKTICLDFSKWLRNKEIQVPSDNKYGVWFRDGVSQKIYFYNLYIKIRHKVAIIVKSGMRCKYGH